LELCISGKKLGDDGLKEIIEALLESLAVLDGECCFTLDELNLSGNSLTIESFRNLIPIIILSKCDLKTLDLSCNKLVVDTKDDAEHWEAFLDTFRHCRVLQNLSLGGNDLSKAKTLEIFVRVYARHPKIDLFDTTDYTDNVDDGEEGVEGNPVSKAQGKRVVSGSSTSESNVSMSAGTILLRHSGLRSIPYIDFSNASIDDAGALWLSFIVANHHTPERLLKSLKAAAGPPSPNSVDDIACNGLNYLPNDSMSNTGLKLLKSAERVRHGLAESARRGLDTELDDNEIDQSEAGSTYVVVEATSPGESSK
jgi:hypothetical protein